MFREDGAIFVGRYRTYDQGQSWEKMALIDSLSVRGSYLDRQTGHLVAGTDGGLFYSNDDGDTWVQSLAVVVWRVAINEKGPILAEVFDNNSSPPRLVLSEDGGVSWSDVSSPFVNPSKILVGPDGDLYVNGDIRGASQVYRSSDLGANWELVFNENTVPGTSCRLIGMSAVTDDGEIIGDYNITRFSIEDNTCTTSLENVPPEFDLNGNPYDFNRWSIHVLELGKEERMYMIARSSLLYRSDDGGASWKKLSIQGITGARIGILYLDPDSEFILASNNSGLFRKEQNSSEWTYVGFPVEWIKQILAGPVPGSLWISTRDLILESDDQGQSWSTLIHHDDLAGYTYNEVYPIIHDEERGIIYAQDIFEVFYSIDEGETWIPTNVPENGLTDPGVYTMAITPEGYLMVYAVHDERNDLEGIWLTKDLGETWELVLEEKFRGFANFYFDSTDLLWAYFGDQIGTSIDLGKTWDFTSISAEHWIALSNMIETPDGAFWLSHVCGVLRSVDRGETWEELFPGGTVSPGNLQWFESTSELVFSLDHEIYRTFIDPSIRVANEDEIPQGVDQFVLNTYPNPVANTAYIQFSLNRDTPVTLDVYDQLGRKVQRVLDSHLGAGNHEIPVQTYGFAPGMYVFRLQMEGQVMTGSFIHVE